MKCVITRSTIVFPFPSALVFTVDYCDDQDTVVSGSADSTVRIWKMSTGQCLQTRYGHTDWVIKVRFGALNTMQGSPDTLTTGKNFCLVFMEVLAT